jgi:outer membrane protein TolC
MCCLNQNWSSRIEFFVATHYGKANCFAMTDQATSIRSRLQPIFRPLLCAAWAAFFCAGFVAAQTPAPPASQAGLPAVTSSPNALTLQQVLDVVQAKNPTLLAARTNLEAVRAQEIQAGVRANPSFTLAGTDITLPAEGASNPYSYSAQVSRLFERGDKRRWRLDVARSTTEQTSAQLQDQQRQIVFAVKQAFVNMLMAKAALQLAQDNLKDFRHEIDINNERYKAGELPGADAGWLYEPG